MRSWAGMALALGMTGCAGPAALNDRTAARCSSAPLAATTLYLRGSMNGWAPDEDYAFKFHCDGYYLNVDLSAGQEFKIADANWTPQTSFGAPSNQSGDLSTGVASPLARGSDPGAAVNLRYRFEGEQTLALRWQGEQALIEIGPRSYTDPGAPPISDPLALSVHYDSRDLTHKAPFGAVVAGSEVAYTLSAMAGIEHVDLVIEKRLLEGNQDRIEYHELARVPMTLQIDGDQARWRAQHRYDSIGVYGYWFEIQIGAQRYVYQNNRDLVYWTRERGSGGLGLIDFMPAESQRIRRFRQSVYLAELQVPDWAPDIVYYYIFPERFRNGDTSNDPVPGVSRMRDQDVEFHQDWNDRPFLNGSGDGSDAVYSNDFFGGDLAGIIEKLDDIRELGANTLYLTPIFRAASNHKYDTADYRNIDPGFGSNDDFARLVASARDRGMRVLLDASFNHSGSDSIYFDRYAKYPQVGAFEGGVIRADSPYADWYRFDPTQTDPSLRYQGWSGVRDLPEFNKDSPGFRQFVFGVPDGITQLWLDRGAAGWRMDVAPWVQDEFWRQWRKAVKSHNPDALTVAETWFDASAHLLGDMFDSTMNYIFRNSVLDYAAGGRADRLYPNIELLRESYPPQTFYAAMNLLSTHDQARSLHVLGYHGADTAPAEVALAKQRFRLALLFQMTFPGAPAVFYGDEVGVTGGDDPFNRVTWPWPDLGGEPDLQLRADLRQLIALRHTHDVLRRGSIDAPLHLNQHQIVWLRELDQTVAIVALNNAEQPQDLDLPLPAELAGRSFADAWTGRVHTAHHGRLRLTLPPLYGLVLISPCADCDAP